MMLNSQLPKRGFSTADGTLDADVIKTVQESWAKVIPLGEVYIGVLLFKEIFRLAPGA